MSATGRNKEPRHEHDFYQTPIAHVRAAFDLLPDSISPSAVLDPGAGTGVWGQEARRRWPYVDICGFEIRSVDRPDGYNLWNSPSDFLEASEKRVKSWGLIVGNPPYNVAEAFIRRSMALLSDGGYLLFLLRLNYLESQTRGYGLWREFPPCRIGVYIQRPSFTGNGNTDPTGYMACLWKKGYQGEPTLRWLDTDTAEEAGKQQSLFEVQHEAQT
jgi:hypothetical protein